MNCSTWIGLPPSWQNAEVPHENLEAHRTGAQDSRPGRRRLGVPGAEWAVIKDLKDAPNGEELLQAYNDVEEDR